ncbi:hypothetical protein SLS60_002089 [Paraconiothyrium brasiliense]|uniref:Uncharacterized protein n=1 Tax=Paraconiothyrium brasiliense TaxID=300254 RepID=A0ABR3S2I2_9PLEO
MIARPRTATSTLPASLILTPRAQKQYRRYQSQTSDLPPKRQGRLPNATEYADFQSWLAKRDSGYLSDTPLADIAYYAERASEQREEKGKASVCEHTLHPTYQERAERCPVCTVEVHMTYMKALTVALEATGGLMKQRWEATDQDCPVLQAWYAGKLALIKELGRLESLAQDEQDYDQEHQEKEHQQKGNSSQATSEVKTATQALDIYWDSMEANATMRRLPCSEKARTVVFCPETKFEQGRDQLYFWRKSPRYEAGGKYAPPSDDEDHEGEVKECSETTTSTRRESCAASSDTREVFVLKHDRNDEEESDGESSDLEDDDDDDDEEEGEEEDEDEDDEENDDDVDASFIIFEDEQLVVQGAEFVVFED